MLRGGKGILSPSGAFMQVTLAELNTDPEAVKLLKELLFSYGASRGMDECFDNSGGVRAPYRLLLKQLAVKGRGFLSAAQEIAEHFLQGHGVTFAVAGDTEGMERIFPLDVLPRIIPQEEWRLIEAGLVQRLIALNLFLEDLYHKGHILRDGTLPSWLVRSSLQYQEAMQGVSVPRGIYVGILGSDLIRDENGRWLVLEDNLRVPSGASYMVANRAALKAALPELLESYSVLPVESYPTLLWETLRELAPPGASEPQAAVLTPGPYNFAYFEHAWLAWAMGVPLVQGEDLEVRDQYLYLRSFQGRRRVDVLYRRVNDEFLDPTVFRSDSLLGVPGLFDVYRKGRVNLVNAVGTGVADDKAIYPWVPKIIRYFLGEDPLLPNVPTYLCAVPEEAEYVLDHLEELVVKEVNQSGGHGMLLGPLATESERSLFKEKIRSCPRRFIAQPTVWFSQAPCFVHGTLQPRRVDLRPFVLCGEHVRVIPGGLSRVALKEGSLVVNSCQGGGSKDTWVLFS
jgi:uncharacterized circularly permuted ATP-grasp superfamily protein